jgi:molybdenum cofactor cytidylyltransferase
MATADAARERPFLSGIVLAAGASVRMGRPKQLLPLGDRCLLERVVDEAAASRLDEIVVVLGHQADALCNALRFPPGRSTHIVINPDYEEGQSTSLRLGLRSADPRGVAAAVLLGDEPGVTHDLIDAVADAFLAGGRPAARPVYVAGGRRVPGHPVFLARRLWSEAAALTGDEGARALFATHPERLLEVTRLRPAPADIDTWDDYRRIVEAMTRP